MRYKKIKAMAIGMSLTMLLLSACGNGNSEEIAEVMADTSDIEVEAETEIEVPDTVEDVGEEEGKEEENEAEEIEEEPLAMVPYFEENELEFNKNMLVETKAVRTNINDETDMEVADAEWTLKSITIENDEDGKQIITIESTCKSYYWTDRKNRQMYSVVLPIVRYCNLNSGQLFPNLNKTGDMELGYIVDVEWDGDGIKYELDYSGSSEWDDDGDWTFDEESGGYIHPTTVHYVDKFVVAPQGYDSLGMIIVPLAISDMEDREDGVLEDEALIKEVLDEREGCDLFSVMDMYAMLNENNSDSDSKGDKDSLTTTENPKESSISNNSDKDNTTPTQEERKEQQNSHTHNYTGSITKNPTCSDNGIMVYTCDCGSSYEEKIPASGHQWTTTSETISHPSTGHYETVTTKEGFCNCGKSGFKSQEEMNAHWENDNCGATGGIIEKTENVWVVDSDPWDEVISVTKCAVCGAQG